ncbi:leucine-rich repeat-containing protein 74A isoform X2 [Lingula anatina]|uniref:Leucine-rich repeat-containing protein 74A isoform X2 n=1 Tax=Lingula anatina TaxID=7574 RepID=A0A1S3HRV0_LINAN|nr:leucine-rich repeat-containing protein 74A isoform X2 [Lingula anatina]|eukprot:XP_013388763.1 leucine-rich repeat-containing protein 74A isoform X2 [Lingula anatina]
MEEPPSSQKIFQLTRSETTASVPEDKNRLVRLAKEMRVENRSAMDKGHRASAEYKKRRARVESASRGSICSRHGSAVTCRHRPDSVKQPPKSILKSKTSTGGTVVTRSQSTSAETGKENSAGKEKSNCIHVEDIEDEDDEGGEEDCDTDLENEVAKSQISKADNSVEYLYDAACQRFALIPLSAFTRQLEDADIQLNNQGLSSKDMMAISIALLRNTLCTTLSLAGNDIGEDGCRYICEMLQDNVSIVRLNVADNNLKTAGAKLLSYMLKMNAGLQALDASGNGFIEHDAKYFASALQVTFRLKELDLSHNNFSEEGGVLLGAALETNDTIEKLNLSWNSLRRKGAIAIGKGLRSNLGVKQLDLSWNGFATEGAKEIAEALQKNSTLVDLDLSSNRIDAEGAAYLAKGLQANYTLDILKLSKNPLTSFGAQLILQTLKKSETCQLKTLELFDLHLEKDAIELGHEVCELRPEFDLVYGVSLGSKPNMYGGFKRRTVKEKEVERPKEPLQILLDFVQEKGINLMELFSQFDEDNSWSVSRDEFKQGMKNAKIPLTNAQMEELLDSLDKDGDGEVDFGELMFGSKEFEDKQREREEELRRAALAESLCDTAVLVAERADSDGELGN